MKTKLLCLTLLATGLSMAGLPAQAADNDHANMEKCYGIAKAGQDDCGNHCGGNTGTHSCKGDGSAQSGDPHLWLYVPKGLCNRINGGSLTPPKKR